MMIMPISIEEPISKSQCRRAHMRYRVLQISKPIKPISTPISIAANQRSNGANDTAFAHAVERAGSRTVHSVRCRECQQSRRTQWSRCRRWSPHSTRTRTRQSTDRCATCHQRIEHLKLTPNDRSQLSPSDRWFVSKMRQNIDANSAALAHALERAGGRTVRSARRPLVSARQTVSMKPVSSMEPSLRTCSLHTTEHRRARP